MATTTLSEEVRDLVELLHGFCNDSKTQAWLSDRDHKMIRDAADLLERLARELVEAQRHVRDHHIEACVTCAANAGELAESNKLRVTARSWMKDRFMWLLPRLGAVLLMASGPLLFLFLFLLLTAK